MINRKPVRWTINQALSRQPGLWRGLIAIFPFWEYDGLPTAWTNIGPATFKQDGAIDIPSWAVQSVIGPTRRYTKSSPTMEIIDDSELPSTFPAKGDNPFTLLLYMKIDALPSNFENIITKMSTLDSPGTEDRSFMLYINSDGTVQSRAGTNTADQALSTSSISAGENALIGVRFDGATGSVIVNEKVEDSANWATGLLTNTDPLCFGGQRNAFEQSNRSYNGHIHIAYVWDRALTEEEIYRVSNDPFGIVSEGYSSLSVAGVTHEATASPSATATLSAAALAGTVHEAVGVAAVTATTSANASIERGIASSVTLIGTLGAVADVELGGVQPPTDLQVTAITDTTADISWTDTNGGAANPRIYKRINGQTEWEFVEKLATTETTYQYTGLLSSTTYDFAVAYAI